MSHGHCGWIRAGAGAEAVRTTSAPRDQILAVASRNEPLSCSPNSDTIPEVGDKTRSLSRGGQIQAFGSTCCRAGYRGQMTPRILYYNIYHDFVILIQGPHYAGRFTSNTVHLLSDLARPVKIDNLALIQLKLALMQ